MLHIKTVEEIQKENTEYIYLELIKMKFIATTQITKENIDYCIQEYKDEGLDMLIDDILTLYGTDNKRIELKNRILERIALLETAIDNHDKFQISLLSIYEGLYNDTFNFATLPTVNDEGFNLWYSKISKLGVKRVKG